MSDKPNTQLVTLIKDGHTHAGRVCKAGDRIPVTASQAAFLAEKGLIDKPTTTAVSPASGAKGKE
ncbi:DUF7210 family protein [Fulvimonas yonginensis]|uniref:DUF7210 domain-containing protein n=1 Tax=Fulvimonas yonginensis TaxID=1495200 RepID=A0ABU8JAU2_9GAMM